VPLFPVPTAILILPAVPFNAEPEYSCNEPELPEAVVPELKVIDPEVPAVPALAVTNTSDPVESEELRPLTIDTEPPVWEAAVVEPA